MNNTAAANLTGVELDGGWIVRHRVVKPPGHSGGAFSVSYLAERDGAQAFVKAFDYATAFDLPDPAQQLNHLTAVYKFEKNLLEHCGQRKLSRVVRVLHAGAVRVSGYSPSAVNYLIFEFADAGDARDFMDTADATDQVAQLRLSHHATVALRQLHSIGVTHQDMKPSNLLVWADGGTGYSAKLGDLGCANSEEISSPYDGFVGVGDRHHAPPEIAYGAAERVAHSTRRYAADLFGLGNLICFMLTTVPYNAILQGHLDDSQRSANYSSSFDDVLPALIEAHGQALSRVRNALEESLQESVGKILDNLCHPDPLVRGDQVARKQDRNQYALDRFVTQLDLIIRRSEIALRRSAA